MIFFHPGDLFGADLIGLVLVFFVFPIAVIFVLLKVFLGRKDDR